MEARQHRWFLRGTLLACGALLLLCGSLAVVALQPARSANAAEVAQAEALWASRSFSHYRLILRDKRCVQDIEVRNERIVKTQPNRCEPPPRTITDLFTLIKRNEQISTPCIAHGCACEDVIRVSARYDPTLGYPAAIEVRVKARPNWRHMDYWKYVVNRRKMPDCDILAEGSKRISIVSLTPLQ